LRAVDVVDHGSPDTRPSRTRPSTTVVSSKDGLSSTRSRPGRPSRSGCSARLRVEVEEPTRRRRSDRTGCRRFATLCSGRRPGSVEPRLQSRPELATPPSFVGDEGRIDHGEPWSSRGWPGDTGERFEVRDAEVAQIRTSARRPREVDVKGRDGDVRQPSRDAAEITLIEGELRTQRREPDGASDDPGPHLLRGRWWRRRGARHWRPEGAAYTCFSRRKVSHGGSSEKTGNLLDPLRQALRTRSSFGVEVAQLGGRRLRRQRLRRTVSGLRIRDLLAGNSAKAAKLEAPAVTRRVRDQRVDVVGEELEGARSRSPRP